MNPQQSNIDERTDALFDWIAEAIVNNALYEKEHTTPTITKPSRGTITNTSQYCVEVER